MKGLIALTVSGLALLLAAPVGAIPSVTFNEALTTRNHLVVDVDWGPTRAERHLESQEAEATHLGHHVGIRDIGNSQGVPMYSIITVGTAWGESIHMEITVSQTVHYSAVSFVTWQPGSTDWLDIVDEVASSESGYGVKITMINPATVPDTGWTLGMMAGTLVLLGFLRRK